ncbi:ABC transporter permease [Chloroflexota bacterium]
MQRFLLRRLIQGVITLFVLSIVVFALARITGDPTDLLVPPEASQETKEEVRRHLGLDKPYHVQYWVFISNAVKGDFGNSLRLQRPAMKLVMQRMPNSLKLSTVAMTMALLLAFPLGIIAAVKKGKSADHFARTFAVLFVTMPAFLVGIIFMELFAVKLGWVPTSGMFEWKSYILPGLTLALIAMAPMTRLLRSSMLDVVDSEYVKLARLKGIPERVVIWKHALRNAVIPLLTMAGVYFGLIVTMAVVVETVFNWPGIGTLAYESIMARDFPVIQAVVIAVAALVMVVNLLVDVAYAYVDPRIRHH